MSITGFVLGLLPAVVARRKEWREAELKRDEVEPIERHLIFTIKEQRDEIERLRDALARAEDELWGYRQRAIERHQQALEEQARRAQYMQALQQQQLNAQSMQNLAQYGQLAPAPGPGPVHDHLCCVPARSRLIAGQAPW